MAWKKATAYKILDRVIIMPVFLIPDLYPVSGDPVFDGLAKDSGCRSQGFVPVADGSFRLPDRFDQSGISQGGSVQVLEGIP
jgi:hypothetical protein